MKKFIQRKRLKGAYINYVMAVKELDCGEKLALNISTDIYELKQKLIKEHRKMKELDDKCPPLKLNLIH